MKNEKNTIALSQEQIIQKLEYFCAYRERCMAEVVQKMTLIKVQSDEFDFYIQHLKENNFLNETRFSDSFAHGKNAIKKWGKKKIESQLIAKKINADTIQQSLSKLDEEQYVLKLQDILLKKNKQLKEIDEYKRRHKLIQFALQKGYEYDLIQDILKNIDLYN